MKLSEAIIARRKEMGFTILKLSMLSGIDQALLSKYENDQSLFAGEKIIGWAQVALPGFLPADHSPGNGQTHPPGVFAPGGFGQAKNGNG